MAKIKLHKSINKPKVVRQKLGGHYRHLSNKDISNTLSEK